MDKVIIRLARVVSVESVSDKDNGNGLRIKANLKPDSTAGDPKDLPWYFPLLPKTFQVVPKVGECVLVLFDEAGSIDCQGYYIGPVISQPQYQEKCNFQTATAYLKDHHEKPLAAISNCADTNGSFPNNTDVAVEGRGAEDLILRYRDDKTSEVDLRAGIRFSTGNLDNPDMIGNIVFNNIDPAYIQLKYKAGLASGNKKQANSIINMVADRINIMSNRDNTIAHNIHSRSSLVEEEHMDEIMDNLHQVPMGDKLVELLKIIKGAIMHHVHPWAGMEQCGDWPGYIKKLDGYDIDSILSEYVRIS